MVMEAAGAAAATLGDVLSNVPGSKATLKATFPDGSIETLPCQFNPTNYKLTRTLSVNPSGNGDGTSTQEWTGTGPMSLQFDLLFDKYDNLTDGSVTRQVDTLLSWLLPKPGSQQGKGDPPKVSLLWGSNTQLSGLSGFITSATAQYINFRTDGTPVQAKVSLTIEGQRVGPSGTNPTSRATNARRSRVLTDGDTLQAVATAEFGRPTYWRAIAALNGIDDPARVRPGTSVLIPSLADAVKGG